MQVNIYLKVHLYCLISPFIETVARSIKRGICLYIGIPNTYFVGNVFVTWIMRKITEAVQREISLYVDILYAFAMGNLFQFIGQKLVLLFQNTG